MLGACSSTPKHSGSAPEGSRRPLPDGLGVGTTATTDDGSRHVAESEVLLGVLATRVFHRKTCSHLDGVADRDRVPFVNPYDGLDSGYYPCPDCASGPR